MKRTDDVGLEVCLSDVPAELRSSRFALLANRASVDRSFRFAWDLLADRFSGQLIALMTPQHGLWGDAQANMIESDHGWHEQLDMPIYSLYSETRRPSPAMLDGVETLVVDLQDVGTRVYTFIWTLLECLRACADAGVAVLVLDRPNPIGGRVVEGPVLSESFTSFVGNAPIPMRHALSIGEMARFFVRHYQIDVALNVVAMRTWQPEDTWELHGRPWLPPSPNMPTLQSTRVYPGQVLLEGTNISEGRGTTTPFEIVGAPFVDPDELIEAADDLRPFGLRLLPLYFRPTFDKWAGELCGGVTLNVTDGALLRSFPATVKLIEALHACWPDQFQFSAPPYEYETVKPPIDILFGSDRLRHRVMRGESNEACCEVDVESWAHNVSESLLYGDAERFVA